MPSEQNHRLYIRAKHVTFKRGKRRSTPSVSVLQLEHVHDKEAAKFYLGKRVVYIYRATKAIRGTKIRCIWGKIRGVHGNVGKVKASFKSNLPPKSLGATLRVMLYPSNI